MTLARSATPTMVASRRVLTWASAALLLTLAVSLPAAADDGLVIHSDSNCPSAEAVREALLGMRPADRWSSTTVTILAQEHALRVQLGPAAVPRELTVTADCAARAATVALVVATWGNDLPAQAVSSPVLQAAAPPSPPGSPPSPPASSYREVGAGVLAVTGGGFASGVRLELLQPYRNGIGWVVSAVLPAPRQIELGGATTDWTRLAAALSIQARRARVRWFAAADAGAVAAYTLAWGHGYAADQTAQSLTGGLTAGLRIGIPWHRFRLWLAVHGVAWLYRQRIQIDDDGGGVSRGSLPDWDAQGCLGASVAF